MSRDPTERYPKSPMPPQHQDRPGLEAEMSPRPLYRGDAYRPAGKLQGKCALVTGGDSGIGRAVAVLMAREGADVAIVHLPEEERDALETSQAVEQAQRRCLRIAGDVSRSDFCDDVVERTVATFGHLDVLVNNAAYQCTRDDIAEISDAQLRQTFEVNLFGYFFMTRAALKHLPRGGAIVNCGSVAGLQGSGHLLDYSASKAAIHAFTKSLAMNLVPRGIRVNCVAPGPVWTPLNVADRPPEQVAQHGADVPMQRPAQPEEIAPAFVFFASNADSSYISGEVLPLMGGETAAA